MPKIYKIEKSDNGNNVVLKYNEEFKMWVQLEFVDAEEYPDEFIRKILSDQFIENF